MNKLISMRTKLKIRCGAQFIVYAFTSISIRRKLEKVRISVSTLKALKIDKELNYSDVIEW